MKTLPAPHSLIWLALAFGTCAIPACDSGPPPYKTPDGYTSPTQQKQALEAQRDQKKETKEVRDQLKR